MNAIRGNDNVVAANRHPVHASFRRERVIDVSACCTVQYISDVLGRADFSALLVSDGIVLPNGMPNITYQRAGYLVLVEAAPGRIEMLVTPEGQVWLASRYPAIKRAVLQ
ncbi:hypothetical protein POK33_38155 [Burkholderia cenocepacia]|uniref:hypothetical protein n=1 Tax=Burkholderia cenocepacia TaxID=95486 RepID=UPI0023BA35AD|nr:hypothetical protein [Burkholderia cenocepacia]MDF0506579.1 hypothetical protein [Burkholderia cenocepacia]